MDTQDDGQRRPDDSSKRCGNAFDVNKFNFAHPYSFASSQCKRKVCLYIYTEATSRHFHHTLAIIKLKTVICFYEVVNM